MGFIFKIPGQQAAKTYATFNPADLGSSAYLTESNLKLWSGIATWRGGRATQGKSSGKWTFEVTYNVTVYSGFGLSTADASLETYLGQASNSMMFCDGQQYFSQPMFSTAGAQPGLGIPSGYATRTVMFIVDATAGKAWISADLGVGIVRGDPVAGTNPSVMWTPGATIFPSACNLGGQSNYTLANFGATTFANAVPSGFNSGWYE